jgi:hypothetical protein
MKMYGKWNGTPAGFRRTVVTLQIEIATRAEDSIAVLADAIGGDVTKALMEIHEIPACRIVSVETEN